MKAYNAKLYKVNYDGRVCTHAKLEYIDSIIVKKKFIGVKDILTGYGEIDVVNHYIVRNERLDYASRKPDKALKNGYHLVVFVEDLIPNNRVTLEDIVQYVDRYDDSNWKKIYDEMSALSMEKNKTNIKK